MIEQITRFVAASACSPGKGGGLFGFPTWYKYLPGVNTTVTADGSDKTVIGTVCTPQIHAIGDVWLIGAAVLEILLRVAAIAALIYVIWGAVEFVSSQGEPDKTAKARKTVINALVGLVIAITATALVSFVAGRFTSS